MSSKADYKKYKDKLMELKERILNSHHMESHEDLEISPDDLSDESDLANSIVNQSVTTNIRDREVAELKNIEEALQRIEDNEYFDCNECGDEIEQKRLLALPTAKLCIACAEEFEVQRKAFAG